MMMVFEIESTVDPNVQFATLSRLFFYVKSQKWPINHALHAIVVIPCHCNLYFIQQIPMTEIYLSSKVNNGNLRKMSHKVKRMTSRCVHGNDINAYLHISALLVSCVRFMFVLDTFIFKVKIQSPSTSKWTDLSKLFNLSNQQKRGL